VTCPKKMGPQCGKPRSSGTFTSSGEPNLRPAGNRGQSEGGVVRRKKVVILRSEAPLQTGLEKGPNKNKSRGRLKERRQKLPIERARAHPEGFGISSSAPGNCPKKTQKRLSEKTKRTITAVKIRRPRKGSFGKPPPPQKNPPLHGTPTLPGTRRVWGKEPEINCEKENRPLRWKEGDHRDTLRCQKKHQYWYSIKPAIRVAGTRIK